MSFWPQNLSRVKTLALTWLKKFKQQWKKLPGISTHDGKVGCDTVELHWAMEYYRKIHCPTSEFHVKFHMANNFIQHGRRACELCHLLDLDLQTLWRTLQSFTMEIFLTLSKIVLLLLKRQYVRMSPKPVLKKDVWICLWTVYFPNTQRIATSQRRWNFVLLRQHPPYISSEIVYGCAAEQEKKKFQVARV